MVTQEKVQKCEEKGQEWATNQIFSKEHCNGRYC